MTRSVGFLLSATLFVVHISCSDSPTSSVPTSGTIKISVKGVAGGAPNSVGKLSDITSGHVTITSATVVIEKIKFESSVHDTLDFRFRQPFVQDLVVGSSVNVIETIQVPFGSYKESEIEIDDLGPDDGGTYTQYPELQDRSMVIKGYLNGNSDDNFVYTSKLSEEQKREFQPPLVLDENSPSTNIVLTLDTGLWFVDRSGNPLDPRSSNNKSIIEDNIKNSMEVFEDKDDDGKRDD